MAKLLQKCLIQGRTEARHSVTSLHSLLKHLSCTGQRLHEYLMSFNNGGYDGPQVGMKQALSIHELYSLFSIGATCICWESTFAKLSIEL